MFPPRPHPPKKQGFTLIELLTVMAIITILIGLLFPVIGSVSNNARKTQASSVAARIVGAVSSYVTDYGRAPVNSDQVQAVTNLSYDTVYGDHAGTDGTYSNALLFDILRAIPETGGYNDSNQLNPRQVVYFQGVTAKNAAAPRGGFAPSDVTYKDSITKTDIHVRARSLVDPWGHEYVVWIDANGDGDLTGALGWFYQEYKGTPPTWQLRQGMCAAVASMGPDGQFGTNANYQIQNSDDVLSW